MLFLTPWRAKKYFEKSYKAVDGLWFMKTEAAFGFDRALDIDAEVWKVMPKIQARFLRKYSTSRDAKRSFLECFTAKLKMEGFQMKAVQKRNLDDIRIVVRECPWCELMKNSGREHLAGKVGDRICQTEYSVWAEEFNTGLVFETGDRICRGEASCVLRFFNKDL